MRFESVVDRQIRLAAERGEFDNLPGAGKPLPNWGGQDDELWWIKDYLRREGLTSEAMLPSSLRLARDVERLPERVRTMLSEQNVREAVAELNDRIAAYRHTPTEPFVPLAPVDAEAAAEHWRAYQKTPPEAPAAERKKRRFGWR
ncbi:DUF1992 domain-containing protein [Luedemannella flava]|uniref:DUF1992 domain-containing protein n=1 Tax=Luedemannella flava TaxID=349316 RepID=A0ABN2M3B4_9ACTN